MTPTEEQIKAATQARIRQALAAIQSAQDQLSTACQMLSALEYGNPTYQKASKLYDSVHAFWYKVDGLQHHPKVRLDRTNIEALARRLDQLDQQKQDTKT